MPWTICLSGPAIEAAGENVNTDVVNYTTNQVDMDKASDDAEGFIELMTGKTYISSFSSLPTGIQQAAANVCKRLIATDWIAQDTTGYLSREADTLLNVHNGIIFQGLAKLKEFTKIVLKSTV